MVSVAKLDELQEGKGKEVSAGGTSIALFKVNGKVYAIAQECAHQGGPLADGDLEGTVVMCPWHGMTYDITTGKAAPDAWDKKLSVKSFLVKVEGNDVKVEV